MYEYLLVVGPGRSGSEFLYRIFKSHPDLVLPEIKEGNYYRSLANYKKALRKRPDDQKLLCDIANLAYRDPSLSQNIDSIRADGVAVLLIVLVRDHVDRALSMMRFRKSRGELSALLGAKHLEQATVRDRLSPDRLKEILDIDADVLTVHFHTLVEDTNSVLDVLSSLCGIQNFDHVHPSAVNESVKARNILLSAFGKMCSITLRKLGFRHFLQKIKDSEPINKMFFIPLVNGNGMHLSEESLKTLESAHVECCSVIEERSERLAEGVYLRRLA